MSLGLRCSSLTTLSPRRFDGTYTVPYSLWLYAIFLCRSKSAFGPMQSRHLARFLECTNGLPTPSLWPSSQLMLRSPLGHSSSKNNEDTSTLPYSYGVILRRFVMSTPPLNKIVAHLRKIICNLFFSGPISILFYCSNKIPFSSATFRWHLFVPSSLFGIPILACCCFTSTFFGHSTREKWLKNNNF